MPTPTPSAAPDPTPGASPRRTPSRAKSEQRVRDILAVARAVFAERGFERATTTEIAARLGISEATVFTYFEGKRALCLRVIGDWYDEIIAAVSHGLPRQAPLRAQLHFIVHTHLRLFLTQGTGLCALVLSEGRARGHGLEDELLPLQRRYTAPLMDVLARGQASGEIRADLPLRLLRPLVLGPMEHLLWEVIGTGRLPDDIDATAEQLTGLLWQALQPPNPDLAELAALRRLRDELTASLQRAG